jgi:hexosaminidase
MLNSSSTNWKGIPIQRVANKYTLVKINDNAVIYLNFFITNVQRSTAMSHFVISHQAKRLKFIVLFLGFFLAFNATVLAKEESVNVDYLGLIPQPQKLIPEAGQFQLTSITSFFVNSNEAMEVAQLFTDFLKPVTHVAYRIEQVNTEQPSGINFIVDPSITATEGYRLVVTPERIILTAASAAGLFYGSQTLRQLLPAQIEQRTPVNNVPWIVPAIHIEDQPAFAYRGMHLDVVRHFFDKSFIKKYIDFLASHKMNVFHWHLTDDQGWRIEIKGYPKLTELGAKRSGTVIGHAGSRPTQIDNNPIDGYYSQQDIREIVEYAAQRHVEIIPEIDVPGHASALLHAYPQYSCHGKPVEVALRFGVFYDVLCPTESTFAMLKDVFTEVAELFPSQYIHIGGDEVKKEQWQASEDVQQLAKNEGLRNMHDVQSYFIRRVEKDINALGKKIIGWDEILEGGIAPNASIMSWRGESGGIAAALQGHDVIMTPESHMYFDHYDNLSENQDTRIGGYLPIEKVYAYNPFPQTLSAERQKHILGLQGNIWSEYIVDGAEVENMLLPRLSALSEVVWNPAGRNWPSFLARLPRHFERLDAMGANASRGVYAVSGELTHNTDGSKITLFSNGKDHEIRYSLDGSDPLNSAHIYHKPLEVNKDFNLRATAFDPITHQHYGEYRRQGVDHLGLNKTIINNHLLGKEIELQDQQGNLQSVVSNGLVSAAVSDGIIGTYGRSAHNEWTSIATSLQTDGRKSINSGIGPKESEQGPPGSLDVTVDLEKVTNVSKISYGFNPANGRYSHRPADLRVLLSKDGESWDEAVYVDQQQTARFTNFATAAFPTQQARYVRVISQLQQGHEAHHARIYIDELIVN